VASNPGGALPRWMANAAQSNAVRNMVKAMLDRVKHRLPQDDTRRQ
jgi:hypothetical protein